MEECTTEPAKAYLNNDMETIRNHSIMKSLQNYWNTEDLKNSKYNLKYKFIFSKDTDQQNEQAFVIYV